MKSLNGFFFHLQIEYWRQRKWDQNGLSFLRRSLIIRLKKIKANSVMVGQPLLSPRSRGTLSPWGAPAAWRLCLSRWLIFPTTDRRWQGAWQCRPRGWRWHLMSEQNWAEPSGHKCQNSKTHFPRVALQIQLYSFLVHDCVRACWCTCMCKCAYKRVWCQRTSLPDILWVLLALVFRQDCSLSWITLSSLGMWPVSASPPLRLQAYISTSSVFFTWS